MDNLQLIIILLPVLLVSMAVHELMHALTSDWLGDPTARLMGRVSFNPIKHIDPVFTVALPVLMLLSGGPLIGAAKPVQVNFSRLKYDEFGGAIVGMVGPITNLAIAVIGALVFNATQQTVYSTGWFYDLLRITIELNVGLFIFNSIPWPPLDGSRLLYAFAPRPLQEVMESLERTGWLGIIIFILIFQEFGGPILNLMAKFIHLLAPSLVL